MQTRRNLSLHSRVATRPWSYVVGAIACLLLGATASADTVGWRHDGTSLFPDASAPTEWSDDANVAWKTPMPDWGNSSPVLLGDRIFTTAEPDQLICVNAGDGEIVWQITCTVQGADPAEVAKASELDRQINDLNNQRRRLRRRMRDNDDADLKAQSDKLGEQIKALQTQLDKLGDARPARTHRSNGYASSTPVTDGKTVYAVFGSGVVAAVSVDGKAKWMNKVDVPKHGWGHSASPVLAGDTLVVFLNDLHGLDPTTGKVKWTRGVGHGWGTPIAVNIGGAPAVITHTGSIINAATGEPLPGNLGRLTYNAPIVDGDTVYFIDGQRIVAAWKLPAKSDEEPTQRWQSRLTNERYYASPLLHDGIIYAVDQKGVFTALRAADGEQLYQEKLDLGGTAYPSIVLAGDKVLVSSDSGRTVVVEPGRTFKQVTVNQIESFRGTPVLRGSRMYVRSRNHLYCITSDKLTKAHQ